MTLQSLDTILIHGNYECGKSNKESDRNATYSEENRVFSRTPFRTVFAPHGLSSVQEWWFWAQEREAVVRNRVCENTLMTTSRKVRMDIIHIAVHLHWWSSLHVYRMQTSGMTRTIPDSHEPILTAGHKAVPKGTVFDGCHGLRVSVESHHTRSRGPVEDHHRPIVPSREYCSIDGVWWDAVYVAGVSVHRCNCLALFNKKRALNQKNSSKIMISVRRSKRRMWDL